jgi:anti-sigma B factor antagonist
MKAFGDQRIAAGETTLVVDLADCTGMDSTFMGTLAGLAARLSAKGDGALQIADPGSRNHRSLEDLGLDFLMQIDPTEAAWRGRADEIRGALTPLDESPSPTPLQRTKMVLEAHQELAGKNDKNAETFSNVVSMLEKELEEKQQRAADQPGE